MKNVLRYWLEQKDVDGFRIDALKHLVECESLDEEPVRPWCKLSHLDRNIRKQQINWKHLVN